MKTRCDCFAGRKSIATGRRSAATPFAEIPAIARAARCSFMRRASDPRDAIVALALAVPRPACGRRRLALMGAMPAARARRWRS